MSTETNGDIRPVESRKAFDYNEPDFSPTAYWLGVAASSIFRILIYLALWVAALAVSGWAAIKAVGLFLGAL